MMKKIYYLFLTSLLLLGVAACQEDEFTSNSNIGYLRLQLGVNESVQTKTYNPEQMHVQILDAKGQIVKETTNFAEEWQGESISLPVGQYTLRASSAGFDGQTSGFEMPYYAGSKEIAIEKGKELNETVTCTLANVKVTVNFDDSFKNYFNWATVDVDNYEEDNDGTSSDAITPLTFVMGMEKGSGYFPVTDLQATVNVANKRGEQHSQTNTITGVKARDHYILNYSVSGGNGGVAITVDESTRTYTFNVYVPSEPTTQLTKPIVNAWSKLAYLESNAIPSETSEDELLPANMKMQYRKTGENTWLNAGTITTTNDTTYRATITNLEPNTAYQCRMVYGEEEFISEVTDFTTEEAITLYNGNFNEWYQNGTIWYATKETDATSSDSKGYLNSFWDSGNVGASTMGKNPTAPTEEGVHEGKAAMLASQFVGVLGIGKFAAGNIYTGHYCETIMSPMGARLRFGQEFSSRPTQLKGWYKYTRGTNINYSQNDACKSELETSGGDKCAIYIALTDNPGLTDDNSMKPAAFEINNSLEKDDPEHFKYKYTIDFSNNNPHIIAYGTISDEEAIGDGTWKEFTIDLKYRSLERKPKYIIVVASASKYGDYFTGSTGSVMYIDDFELVYGEPSVEGQQ